MGNKEIVKTWWKLDRGLYTSSVTTIDEEIRKAEVTLENLKEEKGMGILTKKHKSRPNEIDGIPIKYNGGNKKIALAENRSKHRKRYTQHEAIVLHWLAANNYHYEESCVTSNSQKGKCD